MGIYNLVSFTGLFVLMAFVWLLSADRKTMNWKLVFWGTVLQLLLGLFIFTFPAGSKAFLLVNDLVTKILAPATAGAKFLFGPLALAPGQSDQPGQTSLGFILAFQAFPTIIFFSALVSILYYFNILPAVVRAFARLFTRLMNVSGAEALVTAANIFVGVEANLTVRPYIARMTASELCTILTAGMATIASSVLALYVIMLKQQFPAIAGHLISASVLSAPAALVMSKIIMPETQTPETLGLHIQPCCTKEKTLFEAIINSANTAVRMIVAISALLIAILGLVALADLVISACGAKINSLAGLNIDWSLKSLFGLLFYPFTFVMGIPGADAAITAKIIGSRLVLTEVVSYQDLAVAIAENSIKHHRSIVITTYALCGFAHLASMAIFVGGISALAPERTNDVARVAFRALVAATLACFMTACIAGTFYTRRAFLLGL